MRREKNMIFRVKIFKKLIIFEEYSTWEKIFSSVEKYSIHPDRSLGWAKEQFGLSEGLVWNESSFIRIRDEDDRVYLKAPAIPKWRGTMRSGMGT